MQSTTQRKLRELIYSVDNYNQKNSLKKIMENNDDNKLYIHTISLYNPPEPINIYTSLLCTFKIFGTNSNYDHINDCFTRQIYTVNVYRNNSSRSRHPTFNCSCKDFLQRSVQQNKVCKHICFVICKFGQIFDSDYFNSNTKIMTDDKVNIILDKARIFNNFDVNDNITELINTIGPIADKDLLDCFKSTSKSSISENYNIFKVDVATLPKSTIDEFICAICCDSETNVDILICPECSNYVHKECMEIWLNSNKNASKCCVYCRKDIWKQYKDYSKY